MVMGFFARNLFFDCFFEPSCSYRHTEEHAVAHQLHDQARRSARKKFSCGQIQFIKIHLTKDTAAAIYQQV